VASKEAIYTVLLSIFISALFSGWYASVPQSKRSVLENNLSILTDTTIRNGIDTLRGQGLESGWPGFIERVLLNKLSFVKIGLLHWLTHISPSLHFGQLDSSGVHGFSSMGLWTKILIVPIGFGIVSVLVKPSRKKTLLILLIFFLLLPSAFIYPNINYELVVLISPFLAITMVYGLMNMKDWIRKAILVLVVFELAINFINLQPEDKNANFTRSSWVTSIVDYSYSNSRNRVILVSDDILNDIGPFIQWYSQFKTPFEEEIGLAYKFRQYEFENIKLISSDDNFRSCSKDEGNQIIASERDLKRVKRFLNLHQVDRIFKDSLDNDIAYLLPRVCIEH
jgi:hypothetical protein